MQLIKNETHVTEGSLVGHHGYSSSRVCGVLRQKIRNELCRATSTGDEKQMTVVDGHQSCVRNEAYQDAPVGDGYERIVGARHHKRRLRKAPEPRQAAPAEHGHQLQVVANVARPLDMAKMPVRQLGR